MQIRKAVFYTIGIVRASDIPIQYGYADSLVIRHTPRIPLAVFNLLSTISSLDELSMYSLRMHFPSWGYQVK